MTVRGVGQNCQAEVDTRRYYLNGWRLLQGTQLANTRLDRITADVVEGVRFSGSPANGNNALRTLRRMLKKAREWKVIRDVPDFKLFKEEGRALRIDDQAKAKLLPVADQPLKDIIVLMPTRECGTLVNFTGCGLRTSTGTVV